MEKPLISVIIPVYNVEKYLDDCVESVVNQTYDNIEVWLVDDGSTDSSGKRCDFWSEKDNRIKTIHKKNGGLSDARNAALELFQGDYVVFIDSDDSVELDYIEYLFSLLMEYAADLAICQHRVVPYKKEKTISGETITVYDSQTAIETYLYQKGINGSAWCKIYKKSLFEEIRYPVGYYYEDMAIICQLFSEADKIVLSNLEKYNYFQRTDSIMNENFSIKKLERIVIAEKIKEYIQKQYADLADAANARCFLAAIQTFREIPNKEQNKVFFDQIWEKIVKYRKLVLFNKKAKFSHRIMAFCSLGGEKIMILLGRVYTNVFK